MTSGRRRRSAWVPVGFTFCLLVAHLVLGFIAGTAFGSDDAVYSFGLILVTFAFAIPGALIVSRQPRNTIGWLLVAIPLMANLAMVVGDYATYALVDRPGALPAGRLAAWIDRWDIVPTLSMFIPVFLLFPDGRIPSPRWRPALWLAVGAPAVATVAFALTPGRMTGAFADLANVTVTNPLGLDALKGSIGALTPIAGAAVLVSAFLAGASLYFRFRGRQGEERQQVRWLAFIGIVFLCEFVLAATIGNIEWVGSLMFGIMFFTLTLGIPAACAVAVFRYRLYDIDVVINKTLVYGTLAAFITLVYVAVVVGIGAIVGTRGQTNLGLSILATATVAFAFQPVRERVERFANRLVYGERATPYELLSNLSRGMAGAADADELLTQVARVVSDGVAATSATIWLRSEDRLVSVARWPADASPQPSLPVPAGEGFDLDGADIALPVRHQGEGLGALSVTKAPGDPLRPADVKLLRDMASQAGQVLRNLRLTDDLQERLREVAAQTGELRESRQRIVTAQDAERRRLERDIHDGAQQHLVALAVKLRLARTLAARDPSRARDLVAELQGQAGEGLETLRDLVRGIYPVVLTERGLAAGLQAQVGRGPVPVEIVADGLGRYAEEAEAAVYYCVLEALQNVAKYSKASRAVVRLQGDERSLWFSVQDDGVGFDTAAAPRGSGLTNIADRLAALGGTVEVASRPGAGATVSGRLPARILEATP